MKDHITEQQLHEISRRAFLWKSAKTAAGVAVAGTALGMLVPDTAFAAENTEAFEYTFKEKSADSLAHPLHYQKLDPTEAMERAYMAYKEKGGWGIAVSDGFFGLLADKYGHPYNQIAPELFIAHAGGYGLATLCGSLGTAAFCIGSMVPTEESPDLVKELFNWYKEFPFPEYQPEYNGELKQTVANSYLCSDSVGNFMKEMEVNMGDPERKARCGGTAADTTKYLVEMLNRHFGM